MGSGLADRTRGALSRLVVIGGFDCRSGLGSCICPATAPGCTQPAVRIVAADEAGRRIDCGGPCRRVCPFNERAGAEGFQFWQHHGTDHCWGCRRRSFRPSPNFGVGFSRSVLPEVLADPSLTSGLHRWFPNARVDLFPDLSNCLIEHQFTGAGPTSSCQVGSVHNVYIQVAAEEGLIGLLTLVVVALIVRRRVRSLRACARDPAILATLRWATLLLIVVLIWWNDNPLYGGQPETLLAALALGILAVPWSSLGADSQSGLGESRPIRLGAR